MADLVDRAQAREAELIAQALDEHRRRAGPLFVGLENCEECGARIPAARRAAVPGCLRCVDCQGYFEELQRRGETRT